MELTDFVHTSTYKQSLWNWIVHILFSDNFQCRYFLTIFLAASLANLADLWAATRSLSLWTASSRSRKSCLNLLVSCRAASKSLSTWAASLRNLLKKDQNELQHRTYAIDLNWKYENVGLTPHLLCAALGFCVGPPHPLYHDYCLDFSDSPLF